MDQKTLRKLQMIELEMLKELDRICRENNIPYILDGGTMLGAVRHGGFIPWDDDVDVRMLRENYDRFCEICKTELSARYFLQTYKTDPGYRWGYARILKNGTVFKRKGQGKMTARNGIFIDIFPDDNLPEDFFGKKICTCISWLSRKLLYSEVGALNKSRFTSWAGFKFLNMFPKEWGHKGFEYLTEKYRNSITPYIRCLSWGAEFETKGFLKKWHMETAEYIFEGTEPGSVLDGIPLKCIYDVPVQDNTLICLAVHETLRGELESIVKEITDRYVWIYPCLYSLMFGEPEQTDIEINISEILKTCRGDARLAVRLAAIEQYEGKNTFGYEYYKRAQMMHCAEHTAGQRLQQFKGLMADWRENGYRKEYPLSLNRTYEVIDGNHRLALAVYNRQTSIFCKIYPTDIPLTEIHGKGPVMPKAVLEQHGFTEEEILKLDELQERYVGVYGK